MSPSEPLAFLILRLSAFFVLIGRAWQHIFWDAPFRTLFWDEALLSRIVEGVFSTPWDVYVTHPLTDSAIRMATLGTGVFYSLVALICLAPLPILIRLRSLLILATLSLTLLAFLYSKDRFYQIGQGVEYACQALAPLFLYMSCRTQRLSSGLRFAMRLAILFTFGGHGLYAIGYYNVPGGFIDMVMAILPVSQEGALTFLIGAGILDFIIAVAIFVPRLERPALAYAVFWGLGTSLARILANFDSGDVWATLHQWLPEVIMRLPHAGIPLALLVSLGLGFGYRDSKKRTKALRFSPDSPR